MPSFLSPLFCKSKHLMVTASTFPLPCEREFCKDELVIIAATMHSRKTGTIEAINGHQLEVDLANGEGSVRSLAWLDVRKRHVIGDFIQVCHGPDHGQSGWVVKIQDDLLLCIEKVPHICASILPSQLKVWNITF